MNDAEHALAERIKELRRRHFGSRGKAEFARRLGVSAEQYERWERGTVPPGETLVRICETTGEDLQWLLTGMASRGTVVISGTRTRHQELLTRLARLLDENPSLAAPVEAFVDLLVRGREAEAKAIRQLPLPCPHDLIPIFDTDELPLRFPADPQQGWGPALPSVARLPATAVTRRDAASLAEPAGVYEPAALRPVQVLTLEYAAGPARQWVCSPEIAGCFPRMFGVRLRDQAMDPMFCDGDVALASPGSEAKVGHPALCRLTDDARVRCRIWLGEEEGRVHLGRLHDGELEHVDRERVCWSLEVLYRLAVA